MHPELFLIVYRQQERELEAQLRQRLSAYERIAAHVEVRPVRVARPPSLFQRLQEHVRPDPSTPACCPVA